MRKLTATLCLTIAVLLGSAGISWSADAQKGLDAYEKGDYLTAVQEWKPLAEDGDVNFQGMLGAIYLWGKKGINKDQKKALKWFTLAAKQGSAISQFNLGRMYSKGYGTRKNVKLALKWYTLAAEQGYYRAITNLGGLYERGRGVRQNYGTALYWYKLGAQKGHPLAQTNVGVMYVTGRGIKKNKVKALMWFIIASNKGDKVAKKFKNHLSKRISLPQIAEAQKLARECVRKKYKGC